MKDITTYLFETNAVKICQDEKPFWYTSGKIGPYFINAQFFNEVKKQYETNSIYQDVITQMKNLIEKNINIDEIDYISGGERRDWYFSNILAYLLQKPHITIFKDLTMVESNIDFTQNKTNINIEGKKVLHIADLLNQASSYIRAWVPAIEDKKAKICKKKFFGYTKEFFK